MNYIQPEGDRGHLPSEEEPRPRVEALDAVAPIIPACVSGEGGEVSDFSRVTQAGVEEALDVPDKVDGICVQIREAVEEVEALAKSAFDFIKNPTQFSLDQMFDLEKDLMEAIKRSGTLDHLFPSQEVGVYFQGYVHGRYYNELNHHYYWGYKYLGSKESHEVNSFHKLLKLFRRAARQLIEESLREVAGKGPTLRWKGGAVTRQTDAVYRVAKQEGGGPFREWQVEEGYEWNHFGKFSYEAKMEYPLIEVLGLYFPHLRDRLKAMESELDLGEDDGVA